MPDFNVLAAVRISEVTGARTTVVKAMAQLAALEAAMGEMEAARATFEAKAQAVSDELEKLQQQVEQANASVQVERRAVANEEGKRRRRSGDRTPVEPSTNSDAAAEAAFEDTVGTVEERLQTARRAMARVHNETLRVRAGVDAAKASAAPLCAADSNCCAMLWLAAWGLRGGGGPRWRRGTAGSANVSLERCGL